MLTAAEANIEQGFSAPGIHSITWKDDFCGFACEIRDELLNYENWKPMQSDGPQGTAEISPSRQNGITTGHIGEEDRGRFPFCLEFGDYLKRHLNELCLVAGVDPAEATSLEMNAMAYGAGGWLSPHTDFSDRTANQRLVAWMLYLTAPEDGEWTDEKGGAVRVWKREGEEQRIRPRFNRFAMFRVHPGSFHEIEKVAWQPEWPQCRIALSGWIRGTPQAQPARNAAVYVKSSDAERKKRELEQTLLGALALHGLLAKQKSYLGRNTSGTVDRIGEFERDYRAHRNAPPGTSFLRRVPGPAGCIFVVDEAGTNVYFGRPERYSPGV
jgi:hypothetical protein